MDFFLGDDELHRIGVAGVRVDQCVDDVSVRNSWIGRTYDVNDRV